MTRTSEYDTTWAKGLLREVGLRATGARVAVLRHLAASGAPMSHAEIVEALRDTGFDQSTLFRCLNEISEAGLAQRLDLGDQVRRFEIRNASCEGELEHPHFMCVDCGKLACLNGFSIHIRPSRGPRREELGVITEVLLRGHCGNCSSA